MERSTVQSCLAAPQLPTKTKTSSGSSRSGSFVFQPGERTGEREASRAGVACKRWLVPLHDACGRLSVDRCLRHATMATVLGERAPHFEHHHCLGDADPQQLVGIDQVEATIA